MRSILQAEAYLITQQLHRYQLLEYHVVIKNNSLLLNISIINTNTNPNQHANTIKIVVYILYCYYYI